MDARLVHYLLDEIKRDADRAKAMLDNGNTGWEFSAALDLIIIHNADIRQEIRSLTNARR